MRKLIGLRIVKKKDDVIEVDASYAWSIL